MPSVLLYNSAAAKLYIFQCVAKTTETLRISVVDCHTDSLLQQTSIDSSFSWPMVILDPDGNRIFIKYDGKIRLWDCTADTMLTASLPPDRRALLQ